MPRQWSSCFLVLPMLLTHITHGATPRVAMPHQWSPGDLPRVLHIWESMFYSQAFLPWHSFLIFWRLSWGRHFNLKVSTDSCWSSKHSPGRTNCLNHNNPQKIYMWLFHLRPRSGQSRNINIFGELVLQDISFEIFASYGI